MQLLGMYNLFVPACHIDTILAWFNLMDANAVSVPMEPCLHLSQNHTPSTAAEKAEMANVCHIMRL